MAFEVGTSGKPFAKLDGLLHLIQMSSASSTFSSPPPHKKREEEWTPYLFPNIHLTKACFAEFVYNGFIIRSFFSKRRRVFTAMRGCET